MGTLEAAITLDKDTCRIGDTVTLSCALTNKTGREVRILPTRRYGTHWIKATDTRGKLMREILSTIIDWNESLSEDEIVVLKPGEFYTKKLKGMIMRGTRQDVSQRETVEGVFLDFKDSAVLLQGPGVYSMTTTFESRGFGKRNVWKGFVESKPVTLRIQE